MKNVNITASSVRNGENDHLRVISLFDEHNNSQLHKHLNDKQFIFLKTKLKNNIY